MTDIQAIDTAPLVKGCLTDKVYLVTGASGGLGRAAALSLAHYGATVILSGRNTQKLERLYDEIEQAGYPQAAIFCFDLLQTDEQQYSKLSKTIYNEFKELTGIIHAACEVGYTSPIQSQAAESWLTTHQVNLHAVFMLTKACIPLMHQTSQASCLFISDSSARKNKAYWGAYGVSKMALEHFAGIMNDELEKTSIACNVFVPGPSLLPIRKKTHPGEEESKLNKPEQIGQAIAAIMLQKATGKTFLL